MKPDISDLSVEDLKRLQAEAEALIASKKDQAIEDAYNQIIAIAENVGYSVEELLELGEQKRKKTTRKAVEPRYRNKNNAGETWTGRGKQPKWVAEALASGLTLEDLMIEKPAAE